MDEHRGYINNKVISEATGAHYNLSGLADMRVTGLEQEKRNGEKYRKERESYCIQFIFYLYYIDLNA